MSDSYECAFILGAPRSGTSWLQFMLGSHPDVVTPQELDLFSRYIPPLASAWEHELQRTPEDRLAGLTTALTQEEFDGELRSFAMSVHGRVRAMKPGATFVLEKDPAYSLHTQLIDRLFPTARFLHVIRDGRDVVASLMSASRSWGRRWAPGSARGAAAMWRDYVQGARQASELRGRYLEIRYEALLESGAEVLLEAFRFLGVDADAELCEQIVGRNRFSTSAAEGSLSPAIAFGGESLRRFGRAAEPSGFFRSGLSGGWTSTLSRRDLWTCDQICGDLLASLGYRPSPGAARPYGLLGSLYPDRGERLLRGAARRLGRRLQAWGTT